MSREPRTSSWTRSIEVCLVLAALIASILIAGKLFFNLPVLSSRNLTTEGDAQAIAHIRAKNHVVRRRPDSIPVWNAARTSESLHLNDQIFTDENSSAQIEFTDKTVLDVSEKTLLIMRRVENKNTINLKQGSVFARFQEPGSLILEVNNSTYVVSSKEKSQIQINTNATGELAVEVLGGRIQIDGKNGKAELASDQRVTIDSQQKISEVMQAPLVLQAPAMDSLIRLSELDSRTIRFSWQGDTQVSYQFQIARDQNFQRLTTNLSSISNEIEIADMDAGHYYWRVVASDADGKEITSATRSFIVADETAPVLISPRRNEVFSGEDLPRKIYFDWLKNELAASYTLELADNPEFVGSQYFNVASKPFLSPALDAGVYYWRVKFLASRWSSDWSLVYSFQIGNADIPAPASETETPVARSKEEIVLPEESPLALQEAVIEEGMKAQPQLKIESAKIEVSNIETVKNDSWEVSSNDEKPNKKTFSKIPEIPNQSLGMETSAAPVLQKRHGLPSESFRFQLGIMPTWLETVNRDRVNREYVRSFVLQSGFARAETWIQESWGVSGQVRYLRTSLFRKKTIAAIPVSLVDFDLGLHYKFLFSSLPDMSFAVGLTFSQRDLLSITRAVDDRIDKKIRSIRGGGANANLKRALSDNIWAEIYAEYFVGRHKDLKKRKLHTAVQGKLLYRWSKNFSFGGFYSLDYAKYQFKSSEDRLGKIENYGTRRQSLGLLLGWSW